MSTRVVVNVTIIFFLLLAAGCKFDPPTDVGDDEAMIDASVDGELSPDAMPAPAELATEQGAHDFGDVTTGQTSATLVVVVSNLGEQASGALTVTVEGGGAASFGLVAGALDDCEGSILDPLQTCTAQVRFQPTVAGAQSATLRVIAAPGGDVSIPLTGNALSPGNLVVASGADLVFGDLEIQSQSAPQSIVVQNTGGTATANLTVELSPTTQYTKTGDTCTGTALAPSGTCTVAVRFNPQEVGTKTGSVAIRESPTVGITATTTGRGSARIQVMNSGSGTVTSSPDGVSCGGTCTAAFTQTPVTLVAAAGGGHAFDGWGGACASAGTNTMCSVSLTSPLTMVQSTFRALDCAPNTIVCEEATGRYVDCGPTGEIELEMMCPLGCATGMERCVDVNPSNGLAPYLDMTSSAPPVSLSGSWTINTNTGAVSDGGTPLSIPTFSFNGMRVLVVGSLAINGSVRVTGTSPLAIVANGDVAITGTLDISGDLDLNGPGATTSPTAACVGKRPSEYADSPGAGGGGRYDAGGAGGANVYGAGGLGGTALRNDTISPLVGGCTGGQPNTFDESDSLGGGGGGAVQIVSRTRISLTLNGRIDASGGGGTNYNGRAGSGGGSGGAVLLEAPMVVLDGGSVAISTRGGGGGAVGGGTDTFGKDGDFVTGAGQGGVHPTGPDGGNGGTETSLPAAGQGTTVAQTPAGGGGGSVGQARFNTQAGSTTGTGASIRSRYTNGVLGTRLVP